MYAVFNEKDKHTRWIIDEDGINVSGRDYSFAALYNVQLTKDAVNVLSKGIITITLLTGGTLALRFSHDDSDLAKEAYYEIRNGMTRFGAVRISRFAIGYMNNQEWWGIGVFKPGCNSVGGVSVRLNVLNVSNRSIKYLHLIFTPYNRVNDPTFCTVTRTSEKILTQVGPLNPGQNREIFFENVWYNNTIERAELAGMIVEYMDGYSENMSYTARGREFICQMMSQRY